MVVIDTDVLVDITPTKKTQDSHKFLISHVHKDHLMWTQNKKMKFTIYCSAESKKLLAILNPNYRCIVLPLKKPYQITPTVTVVSFPIDHFYGSIGFFFPKHKILYLGDGRIRQLQMHYIRKPLKTIYYDNLTDHHDHDLPSWCQTIRMLRKIHQAFPNMYIVVKNLTILEILLRLKDCHFNFIHTDGSCSVLQKILPATNKRFKKTVNLCRKPVAGEINVTLSLLYFICHQKLDPFKPVEVPEGFRICFVTHATQKENKKIMLKGIDRIPVSKAQPLRRVCDPIPW